MPTVDVLLAQAAEMERLAVTSPMDDVRHLMEIMVHDLRVQASQMALTTINLSDLSSMLWELAQKQARHQAKLAELGLLRVDLLRQLCERGRLLTIAAEYVSLIDYQMLLLRMGISTADADDCRALAINMSDIDRWAYAINGEVVTNIKQVIGLVELWRASEPVRLVIH